MTTRQKNKEPTAAERERVDQFSRTLALALQRIRTSTRKLPDAMEAHPIASKEGKEDL